MLQGFEKRSDVTQTFTFPGYISPAHTLASLIPTQKIYKSTFSFSIILTAFSVTEEPHNDCCQPTAHFLQYIPEPTLSLGSYCQQQTQPLPSFLKIGQMQTFFYYLSPKFFLLQPYKKEHRTS